jgi:predicted negative regulator of RcsB-dependent stress response
MQKPCFHTRGTTTLSLLLASVIIVGYRYFVHVRVVSTSSASIHSHHHVVSSPLTDNQLSKAVKRIV